MGDYNTLMISARIDKVKDIDKFKEKFLNNINQSNSGYHATAPFVNFSQEYDSTVISMITQLKYNVGCEDLLDWLEPMVTQGIGKENVWAINYSEYNKEPTIRKLIESKDIENLVTAPGLDLCTHDIETRAKINEIVDYINKNK